MKLKLQLTGVFVLFIFAAFLSTGCKKDANGDRVVTMKIASKLDTVGARPPGTANNPALIYNLKVTEVETNEKYGLNLGQIAGFKYVEGFEYILKVQITTIKNPPADGSSESYKLVQLVSQTKVTN